MNERERHLRTAAELLSSSNSDELRDFGDALAEETEERGEDASILRAVARAFLPLPPAKGARR